MIKKGGIYFYMSRVISLKFGGASGGCVRSGHRVRSGYRMCLSGCVRSGVVAVCV